jgi:hypothetical protein
MPDHMDLKYIDIVENSLWESFILRLGRYQLPVFFTSCKRIRAKQEASYLSVLR